MCRIFYGNESTIIEVNPKFKFILIVTPSEFEALDKALINRFEK
jgi:hypothetical protein